MMGRNIWGFNSKFDNIGCFSLSLADTNRKYCSGTQPTLSSITARPSTHQSLFSLVASSISQHGDLVPALAVALSSTLGQHHGEKTKKEINLAVQAVCSMDSVVELWTWNALSRPLTLNQVTLSFHLISCWGFKGPGQVYATSQLKMLLLPVWVSMLFGLLVGFLPLVGMEPMGAVKFDSDHTLNPKPLLSSSESNCSQLTLKVEFSSKVVEHGKKNLI